MEVVTKKEWKGIPEDHVQTGKDKALKRMWDQEVLTDSDRFYYFHLLDTFGSNQYDGACFD